MLFSPLKGLISPAHLQSVKYAESLLWHMKLHPGFSGNSVSVIKTIGFLSRITGPARKSR
jgi:hypothetical protein